MLKKPVGQIQALLLVLFIFGSACGGCGKQPEFCKGLELAQSSGQPLDEVEVLLDLPEEEDGESGLVGDLIAADDEDEDEEPVVVGDLWAEVTVKGLDDPYYTPIDEDEESGTYKLIVPPHPDGIEGGKVKLRIMNEAGECNGREKFEVLPLDPAPDALDDMIERLHRIAERQASALGLTADDLDTDDATTLPTPLWGPVRGLWGADDPDNPNSLAKLAENDAEVDVGEGLELAKALLAKSGILDTLDRVIADLDAVEPLEGEHLFETRQALSASPQALETRRQALCEDVVLSPVIMRDDVQALSYYMHLAAAASQELRDGSAQRMDRTGTILGVVPHPAFKAAAIVLGTAAFYRKSTTMSYANTLPSNIIDAELEVTKEWFEEDSEDTGSWRGGYEIFASSNGFDVTGTILEALVLAIDSIVGTAGLRKAMDEAITAGTLAKDIGQTAGTEATKAVLGEIEGGCVIPPEVWGPFDVSDTRYSAPAEYELAIQGVQGDRWGYKPKTTGRGTITVEVSPGWFPPSSNIFASQVIKPIEVREIIVEIQPGFGRIEPGGDLEIRAVVRNAVDPTVKFTLIKPQDAGASVTPMASDADGYMTATVHGADRADKYPVIVKARSRSTGGLRASGRPERSDFGIYNADERIEVYPPFRCVKSGQTEDYEVRIIGSDDTAIDWTTSGGEITGDDTTATYKGTEDGIHTIRASHAGLDLSDTAQVVVNQCECEYDVVVNGAVQAAYGHYTDMTATLNSNGSLTMSMNHPDGYVTQIISLAESGYGVSPWTPGTYDAVADVALPGSDSIVDSFITGLDDAPSKLTIETFDEEEHRIAGFFEGRAVFFATAPLPEEERLYADVTIRFEMFISETTDILAHGEYNCFNGNE